MPKQIIQVGLFSIDGGSPTDGLESDVELGTSAAASAISKQIQESLEEVLGTR